MIVALLVLILLAVLFPSFIRGLFWIILLLVMLAAFGWLPNAHAATLVSLM